MGTERHIREFPPTGWSTIFAAGRPETDLDALGRLTERYRPVLLPLISARFKTTPEQAEDWFQSFLEKKILTAGALADADPNKGRFRTFLLTSLYRFILNEIRAEQAEKRGGKAERFTLDSSLEDAAHSEPEAWSREFDAQWAVSVMKEATRRLQKHANSSNQPQLWRAFHGRFLKPVFEGSEPVSFETIAKTENLESAKHAMNLFGSAKRAFRRILRELIAEYGNSEQECEAEIAYLSETLLLRI